MISVVLLVVVVVFMSPVTSANISSIPRRCTNGPHTPAM